MTPGDFYKKNTVLIYAVGGLVVLVLAGTFAYSLVFDTQNGTREPGDSFPSSDSRTIGSDGLPQDGGPAEGEGGVVKESRLFQLYDKPVVSSVVFKRSNRSYVRFMEEGTGHVYEYDIADKKSYRISNTSVPKIQEAFWSMDGTIVAFRYEDGATLKAAVAELATSTSESSFRKVSFLPEGIRSLALSPDGADIFYITPGTAAGTATGIVARRDGSSPRILFSSKMPRWFVSWPSANSVLIASPWSEDGGIVYRINPNTGAQTIVHTTQGLFLGAIGGPAGDVLAIDSQSGWVANVVSASGSGDGLLLSIPSSCAFAREATSTAICSSLPRDAAAVRVAWARGEYDIAGELFSLNLDGNYLGVLLRASEVGDRIFDIVNPALAPDASYATFKNRVDGLLWGVVIK